MTIFVKAVTFYGLFWEAPIDTAHKSFNINDLSGLGGGT